MAYYKEATPKTASEKERTCLMCGKIFLSAGPANRRCDECEDESRVLSKYEKNYVEVVT